MYVYSVGNLYSHQSVELHLFIKWCKGPNIHVYVYNSTFDKNIGKY